MICQKKQASATYKARKLINFESLAKFIFYIQPHFYAGFKYDYLIKKKSF